MLKFVEINEIEEILSEVSMCAKYVRDYTAKHERIRDKLMEMVSEWQCGCFSVSKIASELGMDQRTVRAHLKMIEINNAGVFLDSNEKEFCTKEGLILLAKRLGIREIRAEQES